MPAFENDTKGYPLIAKRVHILLLVTAIAIFGSATLQAAKKTGASKAEAATPAQKQFASPEEAAKALADAVKAKDANAVGELFGAEGEDLVHSGDEVQDKERMEEFGKRVSELTAVRKKGEDSAEILIGKERWPMPIPLVRHGDKWIFDAEAGRDEILNRRIGKNELDTIKVCKAYVMAQKDYFDEDPDGDSVKEYASKIVSDAGKKNGLYWPTAEGEKQSPMGSLIAEARAEGYTGKANAEGERPYHGYIYHQLAKQGAKAAGGAKNYTKDGHQSEGFALVAFPAEYGDSGIMTFMVNQDGVVMEKDLGKNTASIAGKMTEYNPDKSWRTAR